ncbi:MAG TPA: SCO family protein [Acidobacteriaceae bacterium]|nr:SCO family protein [Acidobacteriaceae bacterium]
MTTLFPTRFFRRALGTTFACAVLCVLPVAAPAQVAPIGEKTMGDPAGSKLPVILKKATIEQHLGQELPLAADFRDETGRTVHLGEYFGRRPAILALVYYKCPMLCSEELNGLVGALEMLKFTPGKDFDVIVASFDPREDPALAAQEKALYLKRYGRTDTATGWHFLTGPADSINALTKAVGFGYVSVPGSDGKMDQYAHPSSIELITTEGRISQYYLGVEYSPRDMRAGLVEASHGTIGSPVDLIYTYCYRYDPHTARNSMLIVRIVQLGCILTVLALGAFILISLRQDALNGGSAGAAKKANG